MTALLSAAMICDPSPWSPYTAKDRPSSPVTGRVTFPRARITAVVPDGTRDQPMFTESYVPRRKLHMNTLCAATPISDDGR